MLVTVIAVATFVGCPQQIIACPQETEAKGYAVVFDGLPDSGFELFFKDSGKSWSDVPEAQTAADQKKDNPWLVFQLGSLDADYFVRIALEASSTPVADGRAAADFRGYFNNTEPGGPEAMNNFGLHDTY